ncbi:arginine deiminase [Fictibacillus nanhaiensis]|uniref:arginine deiminase family protein n=1 Tax=Fictibacillus nanhaiensis TaxID=742169 RepID=UPI001C96E262|nr:arginine deiminase family protein [Fictibacillus nanhaiensis]MBY6036585.1 arginine deiminase [Fictibacillus nanhaiensis]
MNIYPNCWSEHDALKTVLVCSPSALDVPDLQTAKDVQWEKAVDQRIAFQHHENLVRAMEQAGVKVIDYSEYLSSDDLQLHEQLINRIFVRDLACVFGNIVIPGEAGTSMRRPEYVQSHVLFQKWFDQKDTFRIQANNEWKALEYGDVLILNKDAVFINTGIRTSIESIERIKPHIFQAGFSEIGIIDLPRRPDTLHLDMNCNVAGSDILIAKSYMRYFPIHLITEKASKYQMMQEFLNRHGFDVEWTGEVKHTVSDINFLNLDPETILISSGANKKIFSHHPKLQKKRLIEINVNELEKGGGGIRCMTLPLERIKE